MTSLHQKTLNKFTLNLNNLFLLSDGFWVSGWFADIKDKDSRTINVIFEFCPSNIFEYFSHTILENNRIAIIYLDVAAEIHDDEGVTGVRGVSLW